MTALIPAHYRQLLRLPSYRTFWIGASLSATGDTMNEVGILWVASELEPERAGMAIALSSIAYIVPGVLAVAGDDDSSGQVGIALALEFLQPGSHGGMASGTAHGVAGVLEVIALLMRALGDRSLSG